MTDFNVTSQPSASINVEHKGGKSELAANTSIVEESPKINELQPQIPKAYSEAEKPSQSELNAAIEEINDNMQCIKCSLSFSVDEQLGTDIVTIKDKESEEVVRQIPSEELMVIRRKMDDVVGILFDTKV